jgi:hypothetical protein
VGLLFIASLRNIEDADDPAGIVRDYLAALAPGSWVWATQAWPAGVAQRPRLAHERPRADASEPATSPVGSAVRAVYRAGGVFAGALDSAQQAHAADGLAGAERQRGEVRPAGVPLTGVDHAGLNQFGAVEQRGDLFDRVVARARGPG